MKEKSGFKLLKIMLVVLLSLITLTIIAFLVFASFHYEADEVALAILEEGEEIEVIDNMTILSPTEESNTGIIFYPGAKVDSEAYLPLLDQLREEGITTVLIDMPLRFAFFNIDAADDVYEQVPDVENWYIMGHSLGGAMASVYAEDNQEDLQGLIVLGAYVYGEYPTQDSLTIYGTFNAELEDNIDYTDNIVVIEGGNHAQFGNYGAQSGDPDATITAEEQQAITVDAIVEFISNEE